MREIILTSSFKSAFRKFVRRNPVLEGNVEETMRKMHEDVFNPALETHKLSGQLFGLRACSFGYDCRIVFFIDKSSESGHERIVLVDVETHDEVC